MVHWAELDSKNIVLRVIVADSKEWCEENLGGIWKRTYYDTPGQVYAGIGYEWFEEKFRPQKPYPSWSFDVDTWHWTSPIPYPEDSPEIPREWNEELQNWQIITP
jgi:hypothetical protein